MNDFPKIVHQIWYQGEDQIPEKYHENMYKTKVTLRDYQYIIWDNDKIENFLRKQNKTILDKYKSYPHLHQKVDFARYCILYFMGGLYVDMDATVIKDPSFLQKRFPGFEVYVSKVDLYPHESLLSNASWRTINNGIIYSQKGSKFMENLINQIPESMNILPKVMDIQLTTGPLTFTRIASNSEGVKILDPEYFEPCILTECNKTKNTITVHKHEGSWYNSYITALSKIYVKYRHKITIGLLVLVIYLFFHFRRT